jgi:hypothetical protein
MPQQAATIERLLMAFAFVKALRVDSLDGGEGYRAVGRQTIAQLIEAGWRLRSNFDPERTADRRSGYYKRHLLPCSATSSFACRAPRRFSPTR